MNQKTNQKLLSVITVCRNEAFIEDTCKSVMSQTNQDFEWLVLDGKSTDDTVQKLDPYQKRIDFFVSESDGGIYQAMNKGIQNATGKYLVFLNGGDTFYDSFSVERIMPYLEKASHEVFYGDTYQSYENEAQNTIKTYPDKLDKAFFLHQSIGHQSAYIQKSLFERFGGYVVDFRIFADKEKWLKFIENGVSFQHIPMPLSRFRMDGVSNRKNPAWRAEKIKMLKLYYGKGALAKKEGLENA